MPRVPAARLRASNSEGGAKSAAAVVGLGAVVIDEDTAEAAIAEDGAAKLADFQRSFQPARAFGVEFAQLLKLQVLLLGQNIDLHLGRQIHDAAFRFVFLPAIERFAVVAEAGAALGALRGTVDKKAFAGLLVMAHDVRLAAGAFHFMKGPELARIAFQPDAHGSPIQARVAAGIFRKAGSQHCQQFITLFGGQLIFRARARFHRLENIQPARPQANQMIQLDPGKPAATRKPRKPKVTGEHI